MKRSIAVLGLALAALPLSACVEDGYGYGYGGFHSTPYYGWYDGYYGSMYDGYWGTDSFFYYRLSPNERSYRRGERQHFRRDEAQGGNFRRFDGTIQQPPQGTHMPRFPRTQQPGGHEGGRRDRQ